MPVFHVSGGGSALQDALLSTVYNRTNIFQIEDGVYDPLTFSSNTITANGGAIGYNTLIVLSSVNGAENCIIDGGTVWENDEFGGTMLSAGTRCMFADSTLTPEAFNISCYGITFRNGYAFNERGAGWHFRNGINKIFYDCVVERCFGEVSASTIYSAIIGASSNNGFYCHKCKIRHNIGNKGCVSSGGNFYNCEISNIKTQYAQSILEGAYIHNCIIHDIDNKTGPLTRYGRHVRNSLFYNIPAQQLFNTCRESIYGNTFAMNGTYTGALFSWNTNAKQVIANNVFSTGALASVLSGPEVIVMNNYARSFSGNADRLSGNIAGYDPLFADPVNLNFRLSKYSPCISAGSAEWLSGYYSQYDLDKRRFKDPPSMGAYQFNIRNADMPNRMLPMGGCKEKISELGYDAQVEYLQSTGSNTTGQYIDTRIALNPNTSIFEIKMRRYYSGGWDGYGTGVFPGNRVIITRYGQERISLGSLNFDVTADQTKARIYKLNMLAKIAAIDSNQFDFSSTSFTNSGNSQNFYLFATSRGNTSAPRPYDSIMLYYAKFWNGDTLLADFIPVRIGKTGYLYDSVSGQLFGNQGSGNFILGPDIQA